MTVQASGRITATIASTLTGASVDLISAGWITHSAPTLGIGLDIE